MNEYYGQQSDNESETLEQAPVTVSKEEHDKVVSELESVKRNLDFVTNSRRTTLERYDELTSNLKSILVELVEDSTIDKEIAKAIADKCNLELTKTVNFSGTITFSGTVDISLFEEFDKYELSPSLDLDYGHEGVYDLDYEVDDADESY